jgi:hypothetical protein
MNRVYLGVWILGVLLFWEAMHNYGQEMRKQLANAQKQLASSVHELVESLYNLRDTFARLGVTMEQAARQLRAYGELMASTSWHFHIDAIDVGNEAFALLTEDVYPHQDQYAEFPVHLNLCWRCENLLTENEMEFGLCKNCRQDLEDL